MSCKGYLGNAKIVMGLTWASIDAVVRSIVLFASQEDM